MCGRDFPESQLEHHAWSCDGWYMPTEVTSEWAQEGEAVGECPLCFCPFSAEQMAEHAAFCNGPSYVVLPDGAISCHSRQHEQDPSSCSQHPEEDASTQVTSNIMQLFRSYANVTEPVVPSAAAGSVVPRTSGNEDRTSQNVSDVVAHLIRVGGQLDNDVELNRSWKANCGLLLLNGWKHSLLKWWLHGSARWADGKGYSMPSGVSWPRAWWRG